MIKYNVKNNLSIFLTGREQSEMTENKLYNVAIVGATGAVGQKILKILEGKDFPLNDLKLLSSKRSAGKKVSFKNKELLVEEAVPESFKGVDIALFSAGG